MIAASNTLAKRGMVVDRQSRGDSGLLTVAKWPVDVRLLDRPPVLDVTTSR